MFRSVALVFFALSVVGGVPQASALGAGEAGGDRLGVARDWLAAHPDDAETLRFVGRQLYALERFPEAAEAFGRAAGMAPPDPEPATHLANLIRLGRMDEARAVAETAEARAVKRRTAPRGAALRLVARAMVMAGEFGRARVLLDAALAQAVADGALLVERAELETKAGRPVRAVAYLEKAVALAPADGPANRALVRTLRAAGMPVRAVQAFEAALAAGTVLDEGLLTAALAALQDYGDHRKAVDVALEHVDRFRKSAPVLRALAVSLAALGAEERSAERLGQALALAPPDAAVLALIERDLPEMRSEALLKDLQRRFPWMPELFRTGGTPPRDQAWTWLREAESMERPRAVAHLARGLAKLPGRLRGQRALLLLRLAEVEDDTDVALARLDQAEAMDAVRGDVLARRYGVLAAAGRWDVAAVVAWDWARTRPDDGDALAALFAPEVAERVGWARAFAHLHDHVQRDPDDSARRLRALRRHAGTGGSAVLALAHAQALERLASGDGALHAEGRKLRDQVTTTLDGIGRLVDLDFVQVKVRLETRDGMLEARFHPVTGRLTRFALGEWWIAADWSPDGMDLLSLSDSDGNALSVRRRDDHLAAIEAKGQGAFRAEIAADGSPSAITVAGGRDVAAVEAYNSALALLAAWPRTGLAGARWLKIGP